ncbi:MAG TPA: biopolymer transporter ExbD [Terriglobales bacterium]|jgi:biopolymer transport protein TolR|nr:biopolymer transporter ExbD [Terriglobales bacterium]
MAFSTAGGGPSNPQINVTPLIDVLLVLIIVFMVVVAMSKEKGLNAQIPQPADSERPTQVDTTIVIQVAWSKPDRPPVLKINQEAVKWEELQTRLHDIFKLRAERVAFVRGDDDIDFQYVADVIDLAHAAGVERVGLITSQP